MSPIHDDDVSDTDRDADVDAQDHAGDVKVMFRTHRWVCNECGVLVGLNRKVASCHSNSRGTAAPGLRAS